MSVPGAQATAQAWFPVRSRSSPRSPPSDPRGAATHRTNAFAMEVADSELKPLYQWVDEIPLSRPKRNIARDFADGVLVAEVVAHFYPRLIELHNYSSANAMTQKMYNWQTLNQRALRKLGFQIPLQDVQDVCNNKAGAIERVLKLCKYKMAEFQSKNGVKSPGPDAGAKTDKTNAAHAVSPGVLRAKKTNAQQGYAPQPEPTKDGMVPIVFQSAEPVEMTREEKMKAYARNQDKGIKGFAPADPSKGAAATGELQATTAAAKNNANIVKHRDGTIEVDGKTYRPQLTPTLEAKMKMEIPAEVLKHKDAVIAELKETNDILETKSRKLEQLVRLKDAKIQTLLTKLQALTGGGVAVAPPPPPSSSGGGSAYGSRPGTGEGSR